VEGGKIVFLNLTAMRALAVVHGRTGRNLVKEFYSMRFLWHHPNTTPLYLNYSVNNVKEY
jgi:hypothetical protein